MTSRERMRTALRRREPDRVPRCEQCYWPETIARWRREGMPPDSSPEELFDLDAFRNLGLDNSLRLPTATLEESAEWVVDRDANGVVHKRWKRSYHAPAQIDFLIKTRADWQRYRERLAYDPARISEGVRQSIVDAGAAGQFCTISPGEPVWWVLSTLGMERGLFTLGDDPDFFAQMLEDQAALGLRMTRQLLDEGYRPDGILFSSDLCYRGGMLFSPACYRGMMMDYHREYARLCHEHDMFLILHCDGDVRQFIPLLIEAGFDCIEPLEARAGNDVRELKPAYGDRISFFGNINMDVLATGDRELIRYEVVSKMEAAKVGGGYIHQSDHSVPPTVSYDAYR
ncbi:MAG: uroporphyrinogen decarboxylase family protein, partial [Armatimonadota bacterium]